MTYESGSIKADNEVSAGVVKTVRATLRDFAPSEQEVFEFLADGWTNGHFFASPHTMTGEEIARFLGDELADY